MERNRPHDHTTKIKGGLYVDIFTLSPQILAAVIVMVGTVKGIKRKLPKLSSFLVSILAGIVGTFGITPLIGCGFDCVGKLALL